MPERSSRLMVLLIAWTFGFIGIVATNDDLLNPSSETPFQLTPEPVTESPRQSTANSYDGQHRFPHNRNDETTPDSTENLSQYPLNTTDILLQHALNTTDSENRWNTTDKPCGAAECGPDRKHNLQAQVAAVIVDTYGGAVTLVLGTVGNVLVLVNLNIGELRKKPSSLFLSVMAATDLVFILLGQGGRHFVRAISGVDLLVLSRAYCKLWYVMVPALSMYSDWILAGFSIERAIVTAFPLKARSYISSRRSTTYLWMMLVVCGGYYSYAIFYYEILQKPSPGGTNMPVCTLSHVDVFTGTIRPWLEFTINCILPGTIIVISNVIIINSVIKARILRNDVACNTSPATPDDRTKSLPGMLLGASLAFVILTMPIRVGFVMDYVFPAQYWATDQKQAQLRLFWAVNIFCLYLSHSINVMLYVMTGRDFRLALMQLLCSRCRRGQPTMSSTQSAREAKSGTVSSSLKGSISAFSISDTALHVNPTPMSVPQVTLI